MTDRRAATGTKPALLPDALDEVVAADRRRDAVTPEPLSEFFAPKNLSRPMTRNDYLNLRASEEFARHKNSWWGRLWGRVAGLRVVDVNRAMAAAHERQLMAVADQRRAAAE